MAAEPGSKRDRADTDDSGDPRAIRKVEIFGAPADYALTLAMGAPTRENAARTPVFTHL